MWKGRENDAKANVGQYHLGCCGNPRWVSSKCEAGNARNGENDEDGHRRRVGALRQVPKACVTSRAARRDRIAVTCREKDGDDAQKGGGGRVGIGDTYSPHGYRASCRFVG